MRREVGDDHVYRESRMGFSKLPVGDLDGLSYLSKQLLVGSRVELDLHVLNATADQGH